jgi:hypothetical protein
MISKDCQDRLVERKEQEVSGVKAPCPNDAVLPGMNPRPTAPGLLDTGLSDGLTSGRIVRERERGGWGSSSLALAAMELRQGWAPGPDDQRECPVCPRF